MRSTLVFSNASKRLIVSKTLQETAIAVSEKRGAFHARDILFALQSQGCTEITEAQIRAQLYYDGGSYTGRRAPAAYHRLLKCADGWFAWQLVINAERAEHDNADRCV
jgi:hypothetical protein